MGRKSITIPPSIEKFDGRKYFRCQFSGILMERAYMIPKVKMVDGVESFVLDPESNYPLRWGSFVDGAAAAGYLDRQFTLGEMNEEDKNRYMRAIKKDLGVAEISVAPYQEPTHSSNKLDYQRLCPDMIPDNDLLVTVEQILAKKNKKRADTPRPSRSFSLPQSFYLANVPTEGVPVNTPVSKIDINLDKFDRLCLDLIGKKDGWQKPLISLHHRPLNPKEEETPNPVMTKLLGTEIKGEWEVLSTLSALGSVSTQPSTSSSQSLSSESLPKSSSKRSRKRSAETAGLKKTRRSGRRSSSDSKTPSKKRSGPSKKRSKKEI